MCFRIRTVSNYPSFDGGKKRLHDWLCSGIPVTLSPFPRPCVSRSCPPLCPPAPMVVLCRADACRRRCFRWGRRRGHRDVRACRRCCRPPCSCPPPLSWCLRPRVPIMRVRPERLSPPCRPSAFRSVLGLSGNVSAPAVTGDGGSLITGNAVR